MRHEITDRNPFLHIPVEFNRRIRVLSNEDLRQVWQYVYPTYSDYLKLKILIGQLIGQWKYCTCKGGTIVFEATDMEGKQER